MKAAAEHLLHLACTLYAPFRHSGRPNEPPRVIAIVSNTALGDTLLSTPVVASARASFPSARLLLVVHPRYQSLLTGLPGVDELLTYDGGYRQLLPTARALRKAKVDTVLLAHSNAPQDIALGVFSGAATLLKPVTRSPLRKFLSSQLPVHHGHIIETRCGLVRHLGGREITSRLLLPTRYHGEPPPGFVRLRPPVIGLQLGAANRYKMWPLGYFTDLAKRLLDSWPDATLVLTGSPAEKGLARTFLSHLRDPRIVDHCGAYQVEELPWLLRQLNVLVTNDTGPMHLAIALGTPTVSLFGMTSSRLIGPYQDPHLHIALQSPLEGAEAHLPKKRRSNRAMAAITVESVLAAVQQLLENRHAHPADH